MMMKMENKYKYFSPDEFLRCTPPSRIEDVSESLLNRLDQAREIAGIPFVITSAFRPQPYERLHGRSGDSTHSTVPCVGVDIKCIDSMSRFKIVKSLLIVGFVRIGVYPRHIHVDESESKPQDVIFLGDY